MNNCLSILRTLEPLPGEPITDHSGPVTGKLISEWGGLIRSSTELSMNDRILLFGVFVEMIQNVANHSAVREGTSTRAGGVGRISVSKVGSQFWIRTANPIDPHHEERFQQLTSSLNGLNRLHLDSLFRKQINLRTEGNQGAGLGLIEIARRCTGSLEFKIDTKAPPVRILEVLASVDLRKHD